MEPFTLEETKLLLRVLLTAAHHVKDQKDTLEIEMALDQLEGAMHWLDLMEQGS